MRSVLRVLPVPVTLLLAGQACAGGSTGAAVPSSAPPQPTAPATRPAADENGVRYCRYDPSAPEVAPEIRASAGTATPYPTPTPPVYSSVQAEETSRQVDVFNGLWNAVNDNYVDPEFNGQDWDAIGNRYLAMIEQGLSEEAFYPLLQAMVNELGDEHSYFQSPAQVEEEAAALAGRLNFVGIGALLQDVSDGGAQIVLVFPDGPAAEAGLQPHDTILTVDGGPIREANGVSRTLGPEGSSVSLSVRTPGEAPREVTVARRRVEGGLPVDSCLVPGTRLGYVMLPTFLDETIDERLREVLQRLTASGPLEGVILDMRMNGGGLGSIAQATLAMFLGGPQGAFVTRTSREELSVVPEDIRGSQAVPLVVLVGPETVSYGEVVSGILQHAGRATLVGQPTLGNLEQLRRYDLEDGSQAWIASATFEPSGLPAGIWEDSGILPDVIVPGAWDEFSEANDPALAAAVRILLGP